MVCGREGSHEVVVDNREMVAATSKLVADSVERVVDSYKMVAGVAQWEEPWEWVFCGGRW